MKGNRQTKKYKRALVMQQDQTDCGVACLLTIVNFYGGSNNLQNLRELSGTDTVGTTLLGLYQCANNIGFEAEAYQADLKSLKESKQPGILHVVQQGNLQHYIVCFAYVSRNESRQDGYFIIGDPALGISYLTETELLQVWKSKTLLYLKPNPAFKSAKQQQRAKWTWFKQLIQQDINILSLTMLIGVIATILGLAIAIFSQKLIDQIIPSGNTAKLVAAVVVLFFVLLIKAGLSYVRQHFLMLQSRDFNNRIIGGFFNALVYLPKSFFDTRKTGDMITRMQDTSRIQKNIAFITGSFFVDIIILFSTSFFLITYSTTIALITFCFIPIIAGLIISYTTPIKKHQKAVMSASAVNQSNYIDTLNGISVIKQHLLEDFFTQKIRKVYASLQQKTLALGQTGNRFSLMNDVVGSVLTVTLLGTASFMVLQKHLKVGEMMAIISLAGTLIPAVARLSQINLQLQEAKVAFDRMYDFTSIKPEFEKQDIAPIDFRQLEVKNISFRFPGRRPIVKDLSLKTIKGEIIALLGESGCGKSTTMSILEKFYAPESGDIFVNGTSLSAIYTPSWRNIVSSVPQEIKLFNGTLIENIAVANVEDEVLKIFEFCNIAGFNKFFETLPQGYFTLVGEEGINLSGGQKQLVALARALYRKPQVLLLDEATAAMDRNTELFILQLLKQLKADMAIMLITHKMQTAKIADRIYIIEDGKIAANGAPQELLKTDNFFSQSVADAII